MIYVISKNHWQARKWMLSHNLKENVDAKYVCDWTDFRGVRDFNYVLVDNWFERDDLQEMEYIIISNNGTEISPTTDLRKNNFINSG